MDKKCAICGTNEKLQKHHLSYDTEMIIFLCKEHHIFLHRHATGNYPIKREALIKLRKLIDRTGAYMNLEEFVGQAIREKIRRDIPFFAKVEVTA